MPEETKHGTPTPRDESRAGRGTQVECAEFEALLSDVLDGEGRLSAARKESFEAHRRVCAVCGPLFADVQAGQHWLRALEPVEPPVHLVHNILAATSGVVSTRPLAAAADGRTTPFGERVREWWDSYSASYFRPVAAFVRQPRFVMSFGMIFFSFSLGLNVMGVRPADVAKVDLRPAALRHAYNDAQIRVVKYYDNIRFVYEIESKVRELKRANTPAEPAPQEQKENRKNDTSEQPDQKQDRNYSHDNSQIVLAAITGGSNEVRSCGLRAASCEQTQARSWLEARSSKPPVVRVTTNRRFV